MEIIERYVYAVTSKLQDASRSEIEKEVKALIYEMMDNYPEELSDDEKALKVIEELGNPEKLADNYRGKERYLIGPKHFTKYIFVLKVVLLSVFLGISIATFAGVVFNGQDSSTNLVSIKIGSYFTSLFSALLQGAAWVTVIFSIFEYKNVNLEKEIEWSIKDLPQVPNKKALISRGESIFTIIFSTLFFSVLYFVPGVIGGYYEQNSQWVSIPVFNVDVLYDYKIIIVLIFVIMIIQESLKIIWGKWTGKRAIVYSVTSVCSSILTIIFFTNMSIWNNEIAEAIYKYTGFELASMANIVVVIIIFATILEISTSLYKGFKYGN